MSLDYYFFCILRNARSCCSNCSVVAVCNFMLLCTQYHPTDGRAARSCFLLPLSQGRISVCRPFLRDAGLTWGEDCSSPSPSTSVLHWPYRVTFSKCRFDIFSCPSQTIISPLPQKFILKSLVPADPSFFFQLIFCRALYILLSCFLWSLLKCATNSW